jgi:hypothetical protein
MYVGGFGRAPDVAVYILLVVFSTRIANEATGTPRAA